MSERPDLDALWQKPHPTSADVDALVAYARRLETALNQISRGTCDMHCDRIALEALEGDD